MNGLQIATWSILAATFIIQGYTFWLMRKTAKIRKQTAKRVAENITLMARCSSELADEAERSVR